jgi:hypothetical protein
MSEQRLYEGVLGCLVVFDALLLALEHDGDGNAGPA